MRSWRYLIRAAVGAVRDQVAGLSGSLPHWTLETLTRKAGMGRSAFIERFGAVVGETPLRYLTRWRIQLAKRLLADSALSLEQIAERVGYDSAAAFSRVFTKTARVSPGLYRRNVQRAA